MIRHIIYMFQTNRGQSSRAMATTVMKFKGQFKNIWAHHKKIASTFLYLGKYKGFTRNVMENFSRA